MKTIGLIGGLSYESTLEYYRILNEEVGRRLGGVHSARMVVYSFDFEEVEKLQHAGEWDELAVRMAAAGQALGAAGADFLVIASNTMHKVAEAVERGSGLEVLHIGDATGEAVRAAGIHRVALLGTAFTMEDTFLRDRLAARYGLVVRIPDARSRADIHRIIYQELVVGTIRDASRDRYLAIIRDLARQGAEGVILGCTEVGLLVKPADLNLPVFDTTPLHALAAVNRALG
jgi:aspartate racemase